MEPAPSGAGSTLWWLVPSMRSVERALTSGRCPDFEGTDLPYANFSRFGQQLGWGADPRFRFATFAPGCRYEPR